MRVVLVAATILAGCLGSPPELGPPGEVAALVCLDPCRALLTPPGFYFEAFLAQDPAHPARAAVAMKGGNAGSGFFLLQTTDAGATWSESTLTVPDSERGWTTFGDPVAAFTEDALVIGAIGHRVVQDSGAARISQGRDIVAARLEGSRAPAFETIWQGNGTFPTVLGEGQTVAWDNGDKPWLAASGDTMVAVWVAIRGDWGTLKGSEGNALLWASSFDGGKTWSAAQALDVTAGSPRMPTVKILADGRWLAAWLHFADGLLRIASSSDSGSNWSTTTVPDVDGQPTIHESDDAVGIVTMRNIDGVAAPGVLISRDLKEWEWTAPAAAPTAAATPIIWATPSEDGALHMAWILERQDGTAAVQASALLEGVWLPVINLDADLHAPTSGPEGYGDYVIGGMFVPSGARHVWIGGERGGYEVRSATVAIRS